MRLPACAVLVCLLIPTVQAAEPPAKPDSLPGIAFVGGPVVERLDDDAAGSYHWRDGYVYPRGATNNAWERTIGTPRPGRNLFALVPAAPDGKLTQLTFLKTGSVWDPEPSFDGKKILFSMRKDGEDWHHLFEVNIDGSGLTQLTDGPFNDLSGVYLADGRIVFTSDRSGVLDEYHEERSEFLFRMNADGTGMEQFTFVPGIYFEPTVLQNGTILCSFWDAFHISVAPFIKHETYLISLRPDGTEERHLFGAGEYKFYNRTRHSAIGLTRAGELPDGRILLQSEMGPSIYDPNLGTALGQALAPVFPGTASVQTGGTTHAIHVSPLGTRASPYPLQDGRFLMSATLPGSRDLGIYVVDPRTRSMEQVFDRPNLSEWDAVPIGTSRPRPRTLPDKVRDRDSEFSTFVVSAGRHADTAERNELNRRARFVRVIQADYTDVTTSSHTSLETRVLGTVPIQPDGSIAFEAPAETPLFLETLDARGNRLVTQAGYMAARAGEVKSCTGCHAPQSQAVANSRLQALDLPVPRVRRDGGDLSYRRNDPDEYRRQALITQSPVYRAWLHSPLPPVRRAGLEMLGWLPDEIVPADRQRMVELLADESPEVRRQAAFALAMVGTAEQIPALVQFLGAAEPTAADWQARHYAAMALEAITGENLDLQGTLDETAAAWQAWWKSVGTVQNFLVRLTERVPQVAADDFERDAWLDAVGRTRGLADSQLREVAAGQKPAWLKAVRENLSRPLPSVAAIRAAGLLSDAESIPRLAEFLVRGGFDKAEETCPDCDDSLEREFKGTALAKAAALALGQIGDENAIALLWETLARTVPNSAPIAIRHYQTGPRPEEYTYLRALIVSGAIPAPDHVPYLIALLPYTEGEKPRFEDRTKSDSQRVWLPRILLQRAGLRDDVVSIATEILAGKADEHSALYKRLLSGTNIDRPRSEHGRAFPVLERLAAEQALHLLACLAEQPGEIPEPLVAPLLKSPNHRERIEAAVIFRRFGFSPGTEQLLREEAGRAYAFGEIWSIGKGRLDTQFRDKAYFLMALGAHARDLAALEPFTDSTRNYRDLRLGLAIGLGFRGATDGYPLLEKLAGDPIFSVHRQCENAAAQIEAAQLLAGRAVPRVNLPRRSPLHAAFPPPGAYAFADHTPEPLSQPGSIALDLEDPGVLVTALQSAIDAPQHRNLNNAHARNADRMRILDGSELARVLEPAVARRAPLTDELRQALTAALDSPYPFAHYLAARLIAVREERAFIPQLLQKLTAYPAAADTVGFYWAADTLGRLGAAEAVQPLRQIAVGKAFGGTYGSIGMAYGFAAARSLGMLSDRDALTDLLSHHNVWLRAGVIDGLVERGDAAVATDLEQILAESPDAIVEEEARYGLARLKARDDRRAAR